MGKEWDRLWDARANTERAKLPGTGNFRNAPTYKAGTAAQAWHESWSREAYRVLKPGGHLLAFGGDRTVHRLTCALEDSGFEIRGQIAWIHSQGFPKSLNVSDALRKRIHPDSLCACGQHSTQTVLDSQSDCPDHSRSDDGRPLAVQGSGQDGAPSQAGVRAHSHDGRPADAQASARASTCPDADSARPSSDCFPGQTDHLPADSQWNGSTPSDTAASRSHDGQTEPHKTASRKSDTLHSDGDSAVSSSHPHSGYANLPHCTTCGGVIIPEGLGSALKPAMELVVIARKPLIGGLAANVAAHGTGALNIDGCRIGYPPGGRPSDSCWSGNASSGVKSVDQVFAGGWQTSGKTIAEKEHPSGRWPANVVLSHHPDCREVGAKRVRSHNPKNKRLTGDNTTPNAYGEWSQRSKVGHADPDGRETVAAWECHPECAVRLLDEQSGERGGHGPGGKASAYTRGAVYGDKAARSTVAHLDTGGASRFYYVAKASRTERNAGLDGMPERAAGLHDDDNYRQPGERKANHTAPLPSANGHPTVKPIALMRWLCRLICPPNGTILDPFLGSGSTGCAAVLEGFSFVGIEAEPDYLAIAEARIRHWAAQAEAAATAEANATWQLSMVAD